MQNFKELAKLVNERKEKLYGKEGSPEINERIKNELEEIRKRDLSAAFLEAHHLVALKDLLDDYDRKHIAFKGMLGSSFVAYLLGLTSHNPMDMPEGVTLYPELFFSKYRKHRVNEDKRFTLKLNADLYAVLERYKKIVANEEVGDDEGYIDVDYPEALDKYVNSHAYTLVKLLAKRTGVEYSTELGGRMLPSIENLRYFHWIFENLSMPIYEYDAYAQDNQDDIANCVKLLGIVKGKGNICAKVATTEDLYEMLSSVFSDDPKFCAKVARIVSQKDKCVSNDIYYWLKNQDIPDDFASKLDNIEKLYSRAELLEEVYQLKALNYYFDNYKEDYIAEFNRLCQENTYFKDAKSSTQIFAV